MALKVWRFILIISQDRVFLNFEMNQKCTNYTYHSLFQSPTIIRDKLHPESHEQWDGKHELYPKPVSHPTFKSCSFSMNNDSWKLLPRDSSWNSHTCDNSWNHTLSNQMCPSRYLLLFHVSETTRLTLESYFFVNFIFNMYS